MAEDATSAAFDAREIKELTDLIKRSNENPTDDILQQEGIQAVVNFIHAHSEEPHLFCNKSMYPASVHALILFSFPEDGNDALAWYKDKIANAINECSKCIVLLHRGRVKLKEIFITERHVHHASVERFSEMILTWEAKRLVIRMKSQLASFESSQLTDKHSPVPTDLLKSTVECLCAPHMLRLNSELRSLFDQVHLLLLKREHPFTSTPVSLAAGHIFLAFEGTPIQKRWAFKTLEQLYNPEQLLQGNQIHLDIMEEFEYQVRSVQTDFTSTNDDASREKFYRGIYPFLKLLDSSALVDKLALFGTSRPVDLSEDDDKDSLTLNFIHLLRDDIMSYPDVSLPFTLRVLSLLFSRVEADFWNQIGEFTFQNIMGSIIRNPNLVKNLCILKNTVPVAGELNAEARVADIVTWIDPFLSTLGTSQKLKSIETIALQFIAFVESQSSIPLDVKATIFLKACELISGALVIPSQLYSSTLITDLLARSDTRVIVNTKLVRFFDYAVYHAIFYPQEEKQKNAEIGNAATDVISKALRFDVLTFAQNSYDIHKGKRPSTLRFAPSLIHGIVSQDLARHLELSFQVLCSLDSVSTILPGVGTPPQQREVNEFFKYLSRFFEKLGDVDPKNMRMMLSNAKSLKGYWACVFSPEESVYQSAVDILYETFDAAGRMEGVHALLENSLESGIQAINENLSNLIFIEFYEPCPRAVKVLIDVVQALKSPVDGLFADHHTFTSNTRKLLVVFWKKCWKFLDLIYEKTINWADTYTDLVDFTRDTLELSHAVLGCFKTIKDVFEDGDSLTVFNEITNTFHHMLVWLRLSDPALLSSCVKLISSTIDLATELDYRLEPRLIELLARYGSRAKGFNNKLSQSQTEDILERARIFDAEIVDKIVKDSEAHRLAKLSAKESASSSRSGTPTVSTSNVAASRLSTPDPTATARPRIQMKIDNFGSLEKRAPPVPAANKRNMPLSALELSRLKLKEKGSLQERLEKSKKIAAEKEKAKLEAASKKAQSLGIPRTGKPVLSKSGDSDDSDADSDDSDTGDLRSLFDISKPKVKRLQEWSKTKKKTVSETKREEINSRLRLNVDLKPLYNTILKWSFERDSEYPDPNMTTLKEVPDKFETAEDYQKVYEPLLLVECWQAICSARQREEFKPINISIGSKSSVNDFFDVFFSMSKKEVATKGFTESDLVVLALAEKVVEEPTAKMFKSCKLTCFAKIHEIKFLKGDRADITLRVTRSASLQWLSPQMPIMLMRVMQMTTIEREYSSLFGLKYYNLADQILKAQPNPPAVIHEDDIKGILTNYDVNESQANAIGVSVGTEGFSLIQGPPGTGKTKTILGVIGYMLSTFRASNAIVVPQAQPTAASIPKNRKVLVCAPSNAAVDELVLRMKSGIRNAKGELYTPKLVRLGRSDAVNTAVKDVTLEELVDAQLGKSTTVTDNKDDLFKELDGLKSELDKCKALIADEKKPAGDEVYKKKRELTSKINGVKKKLDEEREKQNSAYRTRELTRRNYQAKILGEAEIICSTLSGSAHDMVANLGIKFDSVIIDEACQCTELSAVIPLRYGCSRCIMVGDPNQLPPTVLSGAASNSNYDQSLFVRMAKNTKPLLLNVQYRMNSAISKFPSKKFYNSELLDGPQNDALTTRPWHKNAFFPPYRFYDITEGKQSQNKKTFSFVNETEVDIALELVHKLVDEFGKLDFKNKIGIITPYKEQNSLLRNKFIREWGKAILNEITFNTIDGFQGQEKEIIIMSCVRADPSSRGVGFLRDFRRMNVALTRPKSSLWILGHQESLVKNELWRDLITDAKERNCLVEAKMGFTKSAVGNASSTQKTASSGVAPVPRTGYVSRSVRDGTSQPDGKKQKRAKGKHKNSSAPESVALTSSTTASHQPSKSGTLPPPNVSQTSLEEDHDDAYEPSPVAEPSIQGRNAVADTNSKPSGPGNPQSSKFNGPVSSSASSSKPPTASQIISSGPVANTAIHPAAPAPIRDTRAPSHAPSRVPPPPGPSSSSMRPSSVPNGPSAFPAASRSGSLPPQASANPSPDQSNSGQLPPRPSSSGTIAPRPAQPKRPKGPASIFIQNQKRRKR
ncbi:Helicase SEN1 [Cyberlindnera fabianii]|uniref:Helicase SEN1 n=1 Tax=Cyberlindnera fabianii TaxID=36022 RepID=A0A1V2LB10_CYBFA|nr:Helicase SEN1 [Cyberlindnera fabianii]